MEYKLEWDEHLNKPEDNVDEFIKHFPNAVITKEEGNYVMITSYKEFQAESLEKAIEIVGKLEDKYSITIWSLYSNNEKVLDEVSEINTLFIKKWFLKHFK